VKAKCNDGLKLNERIVAGESDNRLLNCCLAVDEDTMTSLAILMKKNRLTGLKRLNRANFYSVISILELVPSLKRDHIIWPAGRGVH
jgi:hypothetical protein